MIFKLKTGGTIDLPTAEAVDEAIKGFESELKKLRRLRGVINDLNGVEEEEEQPVPGGDK